MILPSKTSVIDTFIPTVISCIQTLNSYVGGMTYIISARKYTNANDRRNFAKISDTFARWRHLKMGFIGKHLWLCVWEGYIIILCYAKRQTNAPQPQENKASRGRSVLKLPAVKVHGANMGPPGTCRPQMGPMLAPRTLLSGQATMGNWADDMLFRWLPV